MRRFGFLALTTALAVGGVGGWLVHDYIASSGDHSLVSRYIPADELGKIAMEFNNSSHFPNGLVGGMQRLQVAAVKYAEVCTEPARCPDNYRMAQAWGSSDYYNLPYVLTLGDPTDDTVYYVVPASYFKSRGDMWPTIEAAGYLYYRDGNSMYEVNPAGEILVVDGPDKGKHLGDDIALRTKIIDGAWQNLQRTAKTNS